MSNEVVFTQFNSPENIFLANQGYFMKNMMSNPKENIYEQAF